MNRILFEKGEIKDGVVVLSGARAWHIRNVLHAQVGQVLKTGEIDGDVGTSEVIGLDGENEVALRVHHDQPSLAPWADLVLAPPRPRVLKRLLPQLASLGVGRIVLVGAQKVEKDFWGATLLKEENYRPLFVEGLMQAGTSILPRLEARRGLKRFLRDELDGLFPTRRRILAHPYGESEKFDTISSHERLLLAVGPEGGWTDEEVSLFRDRGFRLLSLGARILKTETALVALLSKLN